jgi:hypothetical protein
MKKRTAIALSSILVSAMISAAGSAETGGNEPVRYEVRSPGLTLKLSAEGRIVGLIVGAKRLDRNVLGQTLLEGCRPLGAVGAKTIEGGGMEFTRTMAGDNPAQKCQVVERFTPTKDSVRWELEILGQVAPWSTEILTQLIYPTTPQTRFWTAWSDPQQVNRPWFRSGGWSDPLKAMPLKDAAFDYGAPTFRSDNPRLGWCPFDGNLICLPLAAVLEPDNDTGLSIILSPEDTMRELTLRTTSSGRFTFTRACHRLDSRRAVKFTMDLVAHEAGWRGSLRWMTARYGQFFEPANPQADDMAGTSAYSCQDLDFDVEKMKKMAFRVNWRASFDFPYMGMFLPPVAETEVWTRHGGQKTSLPAMRDYAAKMRQSGFYVLSYFNVAEFGSHVTWPLPARKAQRDEDLWKDCHDFLGVKLPSAILLIPQRVPPKVLAGSIYPRCRPGDCYYTWEDGIVMDCADPAYRDFLLDQARRHIDRLPQSSGICIDRLDWMRLYNDRADDGESWFEGRPARSLMASWNDLLARLGPLMHQAGKVVFVNNHYKRLDLLGHVDGIFDEFTYTGAPLNLTALLTLRKPALGWTDNEAALKPDPDAFFQRYLHLGVYPMAPFPGNDHSLRPSAWVDRQYLDYGPLLSAMRGKKWVLQPHCVESATPGVKVNLFQVPGGYALPVTLGGQAKFAVVCLRNLPGLDRLGCKALHPGQDTPAAVTATLKDDSLTLDVPLKRGCAMVLLRK